jgi:hypothetical protein
LNLKYALVEAGSQAFETKSDFLIGIPDIPFFHDSINHHSALGQH